MVFAEDSPSSCSMAVTTIVKPSATVLGEAYQQEVCTFAFIPKFLQQRLGLMYIGGVKALGEPAVDGASSSQASVCWGEVLASPHRPQAGRRCPLAGGVTPWPARSPSHPNGGVLEDDHNAIADHEAQVFLVGLLHVGVVHNADMARVCQSLWIVVWATPSGMVPCSEVVRWLGDS